METRTQPTHFDNVVHLDVGCHAYLLRYQNGDEEAARKAVYERWVRNDGLAFGWQEAHAIGEAIVDPPDAEWDECSLTIHNRLLRGQLETAKALFGVSLIVIAGLISLAWRNS
jgi:hypothetical protein